MKLRVLSLAVAAATLCAAALAAQPKPKPKPKPKADYSSPKATVTTFQAAAKAGDEKLFTSCFADETLKVVKELDTLAREMSAATGQREEGVWQKAMAEMEAATLELGEPEIKDDKATLKVTKVTMKEKTKVKRTDEVPFVKDKEGRWKLTMKPEQLAQARQAIEQIRQLLEKTKALSKPVEVPDKPKTPK